MTNIRNPLESPRTQISRDGHSALVQFDIRGKRDDAKGKIEPIMAAVATAQHANPTFRIEQFGFASANHAIQKVYNDDFARAETLSVPLTLLVLLFAFGALVAAGIPVLLAFSAVLAAVGLNEIISHLVPAADAAKSVILLVGMAVGVDYSLFYLRREREERAAGASAHTALARAAATSGQAVLISGGTVLIAMAGMLFAGNGIFTSIALGTMIVVFVAVVGSLSVLPAVLHKLGDKVEKGQIPYLRRLRKPAGDSRFWGAVLRPVLRFPAVAVVLAGGLLAAAAIPAVGMHTKLPSFTDLPHSLPIVQTFQRVQQAFPGSQTPVEVVVKSANVTVPGYPGAYLQAQQAALRTGLLFQPFHVFVSDDKTVARIELSIAGSGDDATSFRALSALRKDVIAPTRGHAAGRDHRRHGTDGRHARLQRGHEGARAARDRLRARARLPAPARHVPVGRDPADRDRAEPALGRRRLRHPDHDLPVGAPGGPARLPVEPRDHGLAARCSCS